MSKLLIFLFSAVVPILSYADVRPSANQLKSAEKMECVYALGGQGPQFLCFRNETIIGSTSHCVLRQIDADLDAKIVRVLGLDGGDAVDDTLMASKKCEDGGIDQILSLPIDDTQNGLDLISGTALLKPDTIVIWNGLGAAVGTALGERIQKAQKSEIKPSPDLAYGTQTNRNLDVKPEGHFSVEIFYGTDRKFNEQGIVSKTPSLVFESDRSLDGSLSLGTAIVSIPFNHKKGELEAPSIFKLETQFDPDQHITLKTVQKISYDSFYKKMAARVTASRRRDLFVFVHGYNVTFEDAARRTAQIAFDLKFEGAPVLYSWPSGDHVWKYPTAESNVEWSAQHLPAFLRDIVLKSNAKNIYLIAHSMGTRALTGALKTLADNRLVPSSHLFQNVVLAAPDLDTSAFGSLAPQIAQISLRRTLYASDSDRAIKASILYHSKMVPGPTGEPIPIFFRRLGQAGEDITILPGMESIDASLTDTSFLGHSYLAEKPLLLDDLAKIISYDMPATQRPHLNSARGKNGSYWKLIP